ncbi:MAG: GbsR/MarR family transcriptional regulator, partial [Fidelibacterota bacterium]
MINLTPVMQNFILHWGEMGVRWGINRTVAQMHALLYLSPKPLTAEEISETLSIARSTVSSGLRELNSWGIIRIAHVLGDRRDHFEAISDVWEMARLLMDERKRREIDPTLAVLRKSVTNLESNNPDEAYVSDKLREMLEFLETIVFFYERIQKMSTKTIIRAANLGENVFKLLGMV